MSDQNMKRFTAYRRNISQRDTHNSLQKNADHEPQFEGVVWSDGTVTLRWLTACRSTSVWASLSDCLNIHGHPEYGTEIHWHDHDAPPPEWQTKLDRVQEAQHDWIKHNGGPQPVGDDVWVGIVTPPQLDWWDIETMPAKEVGWGQKFEWSILNQHLIDAARLEGIRLGLEAAAGVADHDWPDPNSPIRNLDPDTIAREAVLEQLTAEAQAQGMGYDHDDAKENTR